MVDNYVEIYPEVIFIYINMPMMNGFQFIEYFEKNASQNLLKPISVILTSPVYKNDKLLAMEVSENVFFLNKPLTARMLEEIFDQKALTVIQS